MKEEELKNYLEERGWNLDSYNPLKISMGDSLATDIAAKYVIDSLKTEDEFKKYIKFVENKRK
jgi:hypothetical protein